MLNTIWNHIVSSPQVVAALTYLGIAVLLGLVGYLVKRHYDDIRFWLMCVWYRIPMIGKNARLARDLRLTDDGWFASEITLCADFDMQLLRRADDPALYDKATRYLQKVQEHGRRPMGFWHWLWILVLVIAEAAMFGYVLAGYVAPGGSEALQLQGAFLIGLLIASVLVWMTHKTGRELHQRALIQKARTWWNEYKKEPRPNLTDAKGHVGLSGDEKDDHEPEYIQLLNRVEHNHNATPAGGAWIGATALLVVVFAVGAFYVRSQTQQTLLAEDAQLATEATSAYSFGTNQLPDEVVSEQVEAADRLEAQIKEWKLKGGNVAFFLLAILFGAIQMFGISLGRSHSLVGRESRRAYALTSRFSSSGQFKVWHEQITARIGRIADAMLSTLQGKLGRRAASEGIGDALRDAVAKATERNFDSYVLRRVRRSDGQREVLARAKEAVPEPTEPEEELTEEEVIRREVQAELDAEEEARKDESREEMRARIVQEERRKRAGGFAG
ncbi:MAG: hypothetical protein OXI15_16345 [Chromatiales bacterium]|nr:hypothetical protein [Chromatiales bacterium]